MLTNYGQLYILTVRQRYGDDDMNKQQWIKALDEITDNALEASWETNQELMVRGFYFDELERLDLFDDEELVGHKEELFDLARTYQGAWSYENNKHLTPIF